VPLGLLYYRRNGLKSEAEVESVVSRESTFLVNNVLLAGITAVIFFGTVYPGLAGIAIDRSFFDRVGGPVFLAVILLAGLCTLVGWHAASARRLLGRLLWPAVGAAVVSIILFAVGVRQGYAVTGGFICGLVFFAILSRLVRGRHGARQYGSYLVHLAIVILAVGVIGSSVYDVSRNVSLQRGQSAAIKGYTLVYAGLSEQDAPDAQVVAASVDVYRGARLVTTLAPAKILHRSFQQPVSEVAIHTNALEDLYVILTGWDQSGTASFTLLVNPLVVWLWVGGGIFLIGGLLAFWPARRRESVAEAAPGRIEEEIERQVRELRERHGKER
jgi:cytochrome c-type biogenesis protein CcmF